MENMGLPGTPLSFRSSAPLEPQKSAPGGTQGQRQELLLWCDKSLHIRILYLKDKTIFTIPNISSDGSELAPVVISIPCSHSTYFSQERQRGWIFSPLSIAITIDIGRTMEKIGIFQAIKRRIFYIMGKIASGLRNVQPFSEG